ERGEELRQAGASTQTGNSSLSFSFTFFFFFHALLHRLFLIRQFSLYPALLVTTPETKPSLHIFPFSRLFFSLPYPILPITSRIQPVIAGAQILVQSLFPTKA